MCSVKPITNILLPVLGVDAVGVTSVITTRVKAGQDSWFAEWQGRIGAAQQQFPGYVGQRVQAPIPGVNADWVAIIAFDTSEHLRAWTDSPERKALVSESAPYIERYDVRTANSAFELVRPLRARRQATARLETKFDRAPRALSNRDDRDFHPEQADLRSAL